MWGTVAVLTAGCSANDSQAPPVTPSSATRAIAAPGVVGMSPAGVTTKIDVPAHSTEEEYFQACHAAKVWIGGRQGDRQELIEAYLAAVQAPGAHGAGTWNTPWSALTLARQAAVIVAAQAAGNGECG